MKHRVNVADELTRVAAEMPDAVAVAVPRGREGTGRSAYRTITFAELDADATRLARGFVEMGVVPGERLVLLVPVGIEFVTLVFALLRSGAACVLVDPGMGRRHFVECLASVEPDGFVAIGRGQALRVVKRRLFPGARHNVTVGRRWFWGGETLNSLRRLGERSVVDLPDTTADDPAAILFTSGSTGPAKGVLYRHETFATQAHEIQQFYGIEPGGVDLACFALFGLFNAAMGTTTVFPGMDFSRPAAADPAKLLAAANDWQVTQAFASPAVWDKLSRHCEETDERIGTLTRVLSCGAPVAAAVLRRTLACVHRDAKMHTPYGATEALPIASIEANEVLTETAERTDEGAGICVGRRFDSIEWKTIRITDEPIPTLADAEELPPGEIGELIVRGPQVTRAYVAWRAGGVSPSKLIPEAKLEEGAEFRGAYAPSSPDNRSPKTRSPNELAEISGDGGIWHRMGDVGYFDDQDRFWYCGRKSHRVETGEGIVYPVCCEAVFNRHPRVRRTALVRSKSAGVGMTLFAEPEDASILEIGAEYLRLCDELHVYRSESPVSEDNLGIVLTESLPVDVRHNAKIDREQLASKLGDFDSFDREVDIEERGGQWIIRSHSSQVIPDDFRELVFVYDPDCERIQPATEDRQP